MSDIPEAGFSDAMQPEEQPSGHGPRLCGARLKQAREDGRETCENTAGFRTQHQGYGTCFLHGGNTPNHVANARQQQARELLGTLGVVEDPSLLPPVIVHAELQLSMAKHLAAVRWLEQRVGAVPADEVPASPWPKLLAEHRREADRLLVECARLGIELAAVRLEEAHADLVTAAIERALARLGALVLERTGVQALDPLDPAVRGAIAQALTDELVAIESGTAARP